MTWICTLRPLKPVETLAKEGVTKSYEMMGKEMEHKAQIFLHHKIKNESLVICDRNQKMTNIPYLNAMQLNNKGAHALEFGDFRMAHDCFKAALDTMTTTIPKTEDLNDIEESDVIFRWSNNPPETRYFQNEKQFVFGRALIIIPATNIDYVIDFSQESAAIVFNLAVVFHLIGLQLNRSDCLQRATNFYEIANSIRRRAGFCCEQNNIEILDVSILNNCGAIYQESCDYEAASRCFDMVAKQLRKFGCLMSQMTREDCDGFTMNCMMQQPQLAAAA